MKPTILETVENYVFQNLLKEVKAREFLSPKLDLSASINKNIDIYLWDWKRGITKIAGYNGGRIGSAIRSALVTIPGHDTDTRTETDSFSHVFIHDKAKSILYPYRFGSWDLTKK